MLKKTAIALSFAFALGAGSSAFAAFGYDDVDHGYANDYAGVDYTGVDAFAQAAPSGRLLLQGRVSSDAVLAEGKVVGRDPDPNVRQQIWNDYPWLVH